MEKTINTTHMKTFLLSLLVILTSLGLQAQPTNAATIKGKLVDAKGEAIPFANVYLQNVETEDKVSNVATTIEGTFTLKVNEMGTFTLNATFLGFENYTSEPLQINSLPFEKDFGQITMAETAMELDGVQVKGMRPQIVVETDKMVMNVENSALTAGNNALEVLEKAPGVIVDNDGNILLNGLSGTRILIDGRPTYLSPKELENYLTGMSADNIKNIEIITNPSSKYDAEGTSGIIDIKLKKNTLSGMHGSANLGTAYNDLHSYFGGANLNYKTGKFSSYLNLDKSDRRRARYFDISRDFTQSQEFEGIRQDATMTHGTNSTNLQAGVDFQINENHSIGAMAKNVKNDGSFRMTSDTRLLSQAFTGRSVFATNQIANDFQQKAYNFHYVGKLDTLGSTLSFDADYSGMISDEYSTFDNVYLQNGEMTGQDELLTSDNPTSYDIYSVKADYTKHWANKMKLETGVKFSRVISDNDVIFSYREGDSWIIDPTRSNHFLYEEDIYAAYGTLHTSLGDVFKLQAGLRVESTQAEGYSYTLDKRTPRNYTDFFPSLFLNQKVSDDYTINYSYSRRIFRPPYAMLNPFLLYADPYTFIQGNPDLIPSYTNSFELTQTFKGMYNFTLGYQSASNVITEVPYQDDENQTTTFMNTNLDNSYSYMARLVVPTEIASWWSVNTFANVSYQQFKAELDNFQIDNSRWTLYVQNQHSFSLPHGIKFEMSGTYRGPIYYGVYQIGGQFWADAGIKKSFLDNKLDLAINATDVFRSRRDKLFVDFQNQNTEMDNYQGNQSVRFTVRYRFSRGEKFQAQSRGVGNQDELNRTGN